VLPFTPLPQVPPKALTPVAALIPRPIPPTGFTSLTGTAPLAVRVVEEEKQDEEAVENARANFSAYHPDDAPNPILPAAAVLLIVIALSGGGVGIWRRLRPRGAAAFARSEVRNDHDRDRRRRSPPRRRYR
jgi:hypothetical protein